MVISCTDCKTEFKVKTVSPISLRAFGWFAQETMLSVRKRQKDNAIEPVYYYRCPCCSFERAFGAIEEL
jgi:hypothetical protein